MYRPREARKVVISFDCSFDCSCHGLRKAFLLTTLPLLLGPALSAGASTLAAMLAGRIIAGIGIGLSSALVPVYISEASQSQGDLTRSVASLLGYS